MPASELSRKIRIYQATALFSVLFALLGFSYNVWRMEVTEQNSNVRDAAFELLLQLAELEQLVFAAHYDRDPERGNPRDGWVKVGLINDLSRSCSPEVAQQSALLKEAWSQSWEMLPDDRASAERVIGAIDATRLSVLDTLATLD